MTTIHRNAENRQHTLLHMAAVFALRGRAHLNAAKRHPVKWLKALWWRIVGKRLRAKAQFAALLGETSQAYCLWLLNEPIPPAKPSAAINIVALVQAGDGDVETLFDAENQGMIAFRIEDGVPADFLKEIDWETSPWFMPLYAGDRLSPNAAAAYQARIGESGSDVIFADDDLLGKNGVRYKPQFKPSWNEELYRHSDYLTGSCIVRADMADFEGIKESNWAARLVSAAVTASSLPPERLPYVLHHRRARPTPRLVHDAPREQESMPSVSVIVPTRNRLDLLSTCMTGLDQTDYPNFEIVIVDNGSDDPATLAYLAGIENERIRVIRDNGVFNFSRLNNYAVSQSSGEILCLLNNDIAMIEPQWLSVMVQQAMRPDVGAVGARLLYPDGRIQHAGVVLGICGGAAHAHRLLWPDDEGYFRRHALPQFVSAVTAACLVVKRSRYEAVGGLDEERFPVAFNDVDFCMRLNAKGWQSLYEPRATLVHHESVSRGTDQDPVGAARFAKELDWLKKLWGTGEMEADVDPWHHPQLSRYSEQFTVRTDA